MHPSEIVPIIAGSATITPWWQPINGTTWQIILSQTLEPSNLPNVQAIDSDMYGNSKATWSAVKAKGYKTICYFSSQYEEWRADAADFRAQPWNLGDPLDVWPGERWVNSRAIGIRAIMSNRMKEAKLRGCDAVDPDNMDAYLHNGGGFGLTQADAVDYMRFLATEAHAQGVAIGLKNGGLIVPQVVDLVDFEVNESCQKNSPNPADYDECKRYQPFIARGKPVFGIEYVEGTPSTGDVMSICWNKIADGFSTLIKKKSLDSAVVDCSMQG